jgi:hypothetical protein
VRVPGSKGDGVRVRILYFKRKTLELYQFINYTPQKMKLMDPIFIITRSKT